MKTRQPVPHTTVGGVVVRVVLTVATVIAPFTLLRVSGVGLAEVLFGLLFLTQVVRGVKIRHLRRFPLTWFWAAYISTSLVGAAYSTIVLDSHNRTWGSMAFDLAAYLVVFATCFTLERMASHSPFDIYKLNKAIFLVGSSVLSALYVYSFYSRDLFDIPLRYGPYFSPLADNLHQVAMFLVPLPFLGLLTFTRRQWVGTRVLVLVLFAMDLVMAWNVGATKASMAVVAGMATLIYMGSLRFAGRPLFFLVNGVYVGALLLVTLKVDLAELAFQFFSENDKYGARSTLYSDAIPAVLQSFVVGQGPGPHLYLNGVLKDAHQTFLTVLLQAGVIGAIAFIALTVRVSRRAVSVPALTAAFAAVAVYALGGDVLRRLPVWVLIFIITHWRVDSARS
ncbi:MAG TPA: O-antigen ligase family protein, partial [Longimicrobiaceae bacterium]|nr:O-antigen ligase family protein [Longimicrobiaceae bacterium]